MLSWFPAGKNGHPEEVDPDHRDNNSPDPEASGQ